MSVNMTQDQVRARTKTVTRRHVGEVLDVTVEPLGLVDADELIAEGFPGAHGYRIPAGMDDPAEILAWADRIEVRRIAWTYLAHEEPVDPR